jgi:hypothetical protein
VDDVTAPDPPAEAGLAFSHVGAIVADLRVAMADFERLGVRAWNVREMGDSWGFDFTAMRTVRQRNTLAYGELPGLGAVELVQPDLTLPVGPQLRLLGARACFNHVAYTCEALASSAGALLDEGAHLYTFSKPVDEGPRLVELLRTRGERSLLPELTNCYVELASGAIIELLSRTRPAMNG